MAVRRVTENRVQEAREPTARLRAADHSSGDVAVGRAAEQFGRQMSDTARQLEEMGERFDIAEVKKADAEDAIALNRLRGEALAATGVDAPGAAEKAREAALQVKRDRLANMKGRRAHLYGAAIDQRIATMEGQLVEHAAKQAAIAERGAAKARAETSLSIAVDNYSDAEAYTDNMANAEREFRSANRGMAEDELQRGWAQARSGAHAQIVENIITLDPDAAEDAQRWIEQHAKEILPSEEPRLRKLLEPKLEAQRSDERFGQFLSFYSGDQSTVPPLDEGADPLAPRPDGDAPNPRAARQPDQPIQQVDEHLLDGAGRVTNTAAQHRARGSGNALDIGAPEGTSIYPPMSGRVVKSWYDSEHGGGWSMLVQHPNGMVTGYAHMRARSPLEAGDEVSSSSVIGSVGNTGKSTGPHLHFTVRNSDGVKLDPQTVDWSAVADGPGPAPVDPGEVKWREPDLVRYAPKQPENGDMYAKAYEFAVANNLSSREYEDLLDRVTRFNQTNKQLLNEQREQQWESAVETLNDIKPENLTDPKRQIPGFGLLDPDRKQQLLELAAENNRPMSEKVKPYGESYLDLMEASLDPAYHDEFLELDIRAISTVTPGERSRLLERQVKLREQKESGAGTTQPSPVWTAINRWYKPDEGKGEKATQREQALKVQLYDTVRAEVARRERESGKTLSASDIEQIVRSEVVTVTRRTPGRLWGENTEDMPRFLARGKPLEDGQTQTVSIPVAEKEKIVQTYERIHGRAPTQNEIVQMYFDTMGK